MIREGLWVFAVAVYAWVSWRPLCRVHHVSELLTRSSPSGDPYRTASAPRAPPAMTFRIEGWAQYNYCSKCGEMLLRHYNSAPLCKGVAGECPRTREHFHWSYRCGHRWIAATKDNPREGDAP